MDIADTHVIEDTAQMKAISDPFRRELLGHFADTPRTTKQVADELGIKTNKLYHHVDHLERVGLLKLVETKPKRGTTERYLQAVARRFAVHPSAYGQVEGGRGLIFRRAFDEALTGIEQCQEGKSPLLIQTHVRLSPERADEFEQQLTQLAREFSDPEQGDPWTLIVAAYPRPNK